LLHNLRYNMLLRRAY